MRPLPLSLFAIVLSCAQAVPADDTVPEPTQRTDAPFRLFRTQNVFDFLKLDTRTGQVWQLQWNAQADQRFVNAINMKPLADKKKAGRFTLYPSSNVFAFILLDQEDGRQWQIQWGLAPDKRIIVEIGQ